jgi:hypothetical protein
LLPWRRVNQECGCFNVPRFVWLSAHLRISAGDCV